MTFRVTFKDNSILEIPIMDANTFGSSYNHSDKEYLKYYSFGKEIFLTYRLLFIKFLPASTKFGRESFVSV